MTKKNIFSKLFVALVVLTLISCCFLGSTFARYTSEGTGSAVTEVATWSISASLGEAGETGVGNIDFGMLSPSDAADDTGTNDTGVILVATITNNSDVAASISLDALEDPSFDYGEDEPDDKDANEANALDCFSIALYASTTKSESTAIDTTDDAYTTAITINANGGILYVYACVTWTTSSNVLDTWIGENVESISWTINYTAVQASEQPTA